MDDYNIPQLINALLSTVKTMNERLGVPTANNGTPATIIGVDPQVAEANIWGSELQVGKYFPNDPQASFLKPLFTGLDSLFVRFFSNILPTGTKFSEPTTTSTTNIGVDQLLGFNSELFVKLATNLGLAVPGLVLFKDLDWNLVSVGIEYLDDMFVDLTNMNEESVVSLETSQNILAISKNLALAVPGFMTFAAVNWALVNTAIKPLVSMLTTLAGPEITTVIATGTDLLTNLAIGMSALGLALIPIAFGLKQFATISWETLIKAGLVIGILSAGLVALGTVGLPAVVGVVGTLVLVGIGIAAFGLGLAAAVYVISESLTMFGDTIKKIAELPISKLPEQGLIIGKFFANIVSSIGVSTGVKLAGFTASLPTISTGLIGLSIAIKQLTPVLPGLETFLQGFINIDTGKMRTISNELVDSFNPIATSINNIGDAINDISFAKLGLLATNLDKVSIKVNTFGPEMEKTNTVLAEQLDIQKQQLFELKNQTMLLSKLKVGDMIQTTTPQQSPTTPTFFTNTRMNYQNSAYYAKSK